ncbi:MAG: hypothetical protein U9R79_14830, partial [Armatimonadota bacterium]|nr:hypothetical protein [Armatimonadota bacterium]
MTHRLATVIAVLACTSLAHAQGAPRVLVLGGGYTQQAVEALGVEHETASWAALSRGDVNPFGYHVLIAAMDSGRSGTLSANRKRMRAFVQSGGVFLGMRNNHVDTWLPSGLSIDRAYHLGEILA